MDKLYIFQVRSGKVDGFFWWDMEIIQTDAGKQFTSKEFQYVLSIRIVKLALVALYHQEINGQVEIT